MAEIQKLFEEATREAESLAWEGNFEEYLNLVIANPRLVRSSHARIHDMIKWAGTLPGLHGLPEYRLFAGEIYGLDKALDRLVQFFQAASRGPEVRKRILLLMGPPASGKSSIANLLKQGLERFGRTDQGATYAIKGCPMQEEPLHLIPEERRGEVASDYGIQIEGDLCPRCRYTLVHGYGGNIAKVKVARINFSQSMGVGIGSFVASSPQNQDIARLVGSVHMEYLTGDRLEGAGKAFRLDGELEAANRGLMEFIEIFKSDERFLTVILGVTQEQVIKLDTFGAVHADEVVIGHSNEEEYNTFASNKETAALMDRIILVSVPYNLRVTDEVRIYSGMLKESPPSAEGTGEPARIAPLTLHVAAILAVLSRLDTVWHVGNLPRISLLEKMRLYDDQVLPPYSAADVQGMQEGSKEGMSGLSPRYVINRLADAMTRERGCLTPPMALKSLCEGLTERAGMSKEERERILGLAQNAVTEYKNLAIREVQRAATYDFQERASQLYQSYVRDAESFINGQAAGTSSETRVDESVLRRVERALNLREGDQPVFRRQVAETHRILEQRPDLGGPGYDKIPTLRLAIERILFPRREEMKLAVDPKSRNQQRQQRRQAIIERLVSDYGYCDDCAQDLLYFVWRTLQGKDVVSIKGGAITWQ